MDFSRVPTETKRRMVSAAADVLKMLDARSPGVLPARTNYNRLAARIVDDGLRALAKKSKATTGLGVSAKGFVLGRPHVGMGHMMSPELKAMLGFGPFATTPGSYGSSDDVFKDDRNEQQPFDLSQGVIEVGVDSSFSSDDSSLVVPAGQEVIERAFDFVY